MTEVGEQEITRTLSADEVATLRHDMRTPVNHIVGYCELLLEDAEGPGNTARRERLEESLRAVRDALEMINASLTPGGHDVTQRDVDALYDRLRAPHARIMESMAALLAPQDRATIDEEFSADVRRIRNATEQLVAAKRVASIEPVAAPQRDTPAAEAVPSGGRGTILIVDDEPNNRAVLGRHLERQGYTVVSAGDGATGAGDRATSRVRRGAARRSDAGNGWSRSAAPHQAGSSDA